MTDITTASIKAQIEARLSALADIANERDTDMQQLKLAQDITHAQIDELTNALEFFKLTETVAAPAAPKPERKKRRTAAQIAHDNRNQAALADAAPEVKTFEPPHLAGATVSNPLDIPSFLQRDKEPAKHGDEA